uniref:CUE domain-containing protein n=1 Tax=Chromera velia CCMP2878 TaxID=1169474 RepID=A0A0G4H297_9ALVE|eukprot:Cvel_24373.t1-p1 / transcript=Cvel_24373.t1 / gene=Cvel_24373 / organism=Chromera_velia_CCMP2878 / gene_product=hypothetical protein / transcript_product=hypothetical protein / location=Cvel_scaffold2625:13695-21901(-) / protein_length=906 / sequence_SO=supercontig / SO=protein_coding / is_pseudo=false
MSSIKRSSSPCTLFCLIIQPRGGDGGGGERGRGRGGRPPRGGGGGGGGGGRGQGQGQHSHSEPSRADGRRGGRGGEGNRQHGDRDRGAEGRRIQVQGQRRETKPFEDSFAFVPAAGGGSVAVPGLSPVWLSGEPLKLPLVTERQAGLFSAWKEGDLKGGRLDLIAQSLGKVDEALSSLLRLKFGVFWSLVGSGPSLGSSSVSLPVFLDSVLELAPSDIDIDCFDASEAFPGPLKGAGEKALMLTGSVLRKVLLLFVRFSKEKEEEGGGGRGAGSSSSSSFLSAKKHASLLERSQVFAPSRLSLLSCAFWTSNKGAVQQVVQSAVEKTCNSLWSEMEGFATEIGRALQKSLFQSVQRAVGGKKKGEEAVDFFLSGESSVGDVDEKVLGSLLEEVEGIGKASDKIRGCLLVSSSTPEGTCGPSGTHPLLSRSLVSFSLGQRGGGGGGEWAERGEEGEGEGGYPQVLFFLRASFFLLLTLSMTAEDKEDPKDKSKEVIWDSGKKRLSLSMVITRLRSVRWRVVSALCEVLREWAPPDIHLRSMRRGGNRGEREGTFESLTAWALKTHELCLSCLKADSKVEQLRRDLAGCGALSLLQDWMDFGLIPPESVEHLASVLLPSGTSLRRQPGALEGGTMPGAPDWGGFAPVLKSGGVLAGGGGAAKKFEEVDEGKVKQVQEVVQDAGGGFIALCLEAYEGDVEATIMGIFDDSERLPKGEKRSMTLDELRQKRAEAAAQSAFPSLPPVGASIGRGTSGGRQTSDRSSRWSETQRQALRQISAEDKAKTLALVERSAADEEEMLEGGILVKRREDVYDDEYDDSLDVFGINVAANEGHSDSEGEPDENGPTFDEDEEDGAEGGDRQGGPGGGGGGGGPVKGQSYQARLKTQNKGRGRGGRRTGHDNKMSKGMF